MGKSGDRKVRKSREKWGKVGIKMRKKVGKSGVKVGSKWGKQNCSLDML
jgi:hypothetical protein